MSDFAQPGVVTTLHDLRRLQADNLERLLVEATETEKLGLILPVTASDMRAEPFRRIVAELKGVSFVHRILVTLGAAPNREDYLEALERVAPLGDLVRVLWTDGPKIREAYQELTRAGFHTGSDGKGRSVWTAFGYFLSDPQIKAFVLHDCDIVNYRREMLARLCLPIVHPSLDFDFCKAYYARVGERMYGRVTRLLVTPLLRALVGMLGADPFLVYLESFRYPLAGELAISAKLARSNRFPSDWGLEVGTLAEVFRNTSIKRVCQVDLCYPYEHKHQELSAEQPSKGLTKMAEDILSSIFRTLASQGHVFQPGHFVTLKAAYLRAAQDAIRQYNADALVNGLRFDRHEEESAVEAFAQRIVVAGELLRTDPAGRAEIPNWTRVLAALPDFPHRLAEAVRAEAARPVSIAG